MALDAIVGWNAKRYPETGEVVKVLAGRAFASSGNTQPLAGNTMSDDLELGKSYVVPTGRKLTVYSYRLKLFGWAFETGDIADFTTYPFQPIGQGTTTNTSDYSIVAHIDIELDSVTAVHNEKWNIFAEERGDCAIEFSAGQYPKIGTTTRGQQGRSPGRIGG